MSSDEPAVEPDPDPAVFDEIAERHGDDVAAELESIWTVICRGWESDFFDLDADDPEAMLDVYVRPERYLTGHELQQLEMFGSELGKLRSPSREFDNLTCLDHSLLRVLRRGARRMLTEQDQDGGDR